jgi:hypothetical protein
MVPKDVKLYVTSVEWKRNAEPPEEDISSDPLIPPVEGGIIIVTAEAEEAVLQFETDMQDRIVVGAEVRVTIDIAGPLDSPANTEDFTG